MKWILSNLEVSYISCQMELVLRMIIASFLGIAIGFERRNRNKTAGIRTHAIVALGASLIMIISKYGFDDVKDFDASRVASQIVSGIGFLGAGVIFVKRDSSVSGLTTAGGIWATAGVGMSAGAGQYFISICGSLLLIFLQEILHRVNFLSRQPYRATIKLIVKNHEDGIKELEKYIFQEKIGMEYIKINKADPEDIKVEMQLIFPPEYNKTGFISKLALEKYVIAVKG